MLSEEDAQRVRRVVRALKNRPNLRIVVEGHTDNTGTAELNDHLGQRRAQMVARVIERQIGPGIVVTEAYGATRPAVAGSGSVAWTKNRRAVVVFKESSQ